MLKAATKGSFRGKNSKNFAFLRYFSEASKSGEVSKVNYVFFIILECLCLFQIHNLLEVNDVLFVQNILVAIGGWPPAGHFTLAFLSTYIFSRFHQKFYLLYISSEQFCRFSLI